MINATNIPQQIVQPNQNVLFLTNREKMNCSVKHDEGSGLLTIRKAGLYNVFFEANAVATAADQDVQLAIEVSGEAIRSALARDTLAAAGDYRSISIMAPIRVSECGGCCVPISVENLAAVPVTLENASITIERVG